MSPSFRLVLKSGQNAGQEFSFDVDEVSIGRDLANALVISDPEVSRRHARLYKQGVNYVIEDLGSTNGTSVNGQRLVGPYILRSGEMITFGEHTDLLFETIAPDLEATVAAFRPAEEEPTLMPPRADMGVMQPPPPAVPEVEPAYAGKVPASPKAPARAKKKRLSTIAIILIVLVVILLCCLIAFVIFDLLNLYCSVPNITNLLIPGACPP